MSQRIIDRSYVGEVLQRIYTSDLNIEISLFSEGGYFYSGQQGKRVPLHGTVIEEAVTDLATRIARQFPESSFAGWWKNNLKEEERL